MMTLTEHGGMILPVVQGMGPTQEAKVTISPKRAAGRPPVITDDEPAETTPGPPGTQGIMQGTVWLVTTAAGRLLMITVGTIAVTIGNGIG